jgi:hypothetical protein
MRITHYEVVRQAGGSRLVAYTVRIARRQFIVTRRLGSPRMHLNPGRLRDAERRPG